MKTLSNSRKEAFFESEKGHGSVTFLCENQGWGMSYAIAPYFDLRVEHFTTKTAAKKRLAEILGETHQH